MKWPGEAERCSSPTNAPPFGLKATKKMGTISPVTTRNWILPITEMSSEERPQLQIKIYLANTLILAWAEKPAMLCRTSNLQNCELINRCHSKLLNWIIYWYRGHVARTEDARGKKSKWGLRNNEPDPTGPCRLWRRLGIYEEGHKTITSMWLSLPSAHTLAFSCSPFFPVFILSPLPTSSYWFTDVCIWIC